MFWFGTMFKGKDARMTIAAAPLAAEKQPPAERK